MRWLFCVLGLLIGCSAINPPEPLAPAAYVFTTTTPPANIAEALTHFDAVIQGKIVKIKSNWIYDDPCGVLATALHKCDGTRAYAVTVRTKHGNADFIVFVPHNDFQPLPVGLEATFLLSKLWIVEYQKCRAGAPYTSGSACSSLGTLAFVLTSTENVWPLNALEENK